MRGGRKAPASTSVGVRPLRRDADAQPAGPRRGCAGRWIPGAGLGGITRFARPDARRPARRPRSVAATAAGGWGCAAGGRRCIHAHRRAAISPGWRRAACTPVARVCRAILPGARVGWHNPLQAAPMPPARSPAARRPSPRPPARGAGQVLAAPDFRGGRGGIGGCWPI